MKKRIRWMHAIAFCVAVFFPIAVGWASSYQVSFATTDCNGDTGFATVGINQIFKIQSAGCSGPDGQALKQMLVRDGSGSYTAYTLTKEESESVGKEIKDYMAARRGVLDRSQGIIVKP